jgi:hypothetical protein
VFESLVLQLGLLKNLGIADLYRGHLKHEQHH